MSKKLCWLDLWIDLHCFQQISNAFLATGNVVIQKVSGVFYKEITYSLFVSSKCMSLASGIFSSIPVITLLCNLLL